MGIRLAGAMVAALFLMGCATQPVVDDGTWNRGTWDTASGQTSIAVPSNSKQALPPPSVTGYGSRLTLTAPVTRHVPCARSTAATSSNLPRPLVRTGSMVVTEPGPRVISRRAPTICAKPLRRTAPPAARRVAPPPPPRCVPRPCRPMRVDLFRDCCPSGT